MDALAAAGFTAEELSTLLTAEKDAIADEVAPGMVRGKGRARRAKQSFRLAVEEYD